MKSYWLSDFIFLILISGIGFIFPWWSVFLLCILWSLADLASSRKILVCVFSTYLSMILTLGESLIKALDFSFILNTTFPLVLNYFLAALAALFFSVACALLASLTKDLISSFQFINKGSKNIIV